MLSRFAKTFIFICLMTLSMHVQAEVRTYPVHNCNLINKMGGSKIFSGVEGLLKVHFERENTKIEIELDEFNQHWESRWFKAKHIFEINNELYGNHLIVKKLLGLNVSETQEYFQLTENSILLGQKVSETYERSFYCELQ